MGYYESVDQTGVINTPSVQTGASALAKNLERKGWMIQNQGTNVLRVCLGGTASSTVYHVVLKGCTSAADGTGGSISQTNGIVYTGAITVDGTSMSYTVMEM